MNKQKQAKLNLNLRANPDLAERIDRARAAAFRSDGVIPSRSDIVRDAVKAWLAARGH